MNDPADYCAIISELVIQHESVIINLADLQNLLIHSNLLYNKLAMCNICLFWFLASFLGNNESWTRTVKLANFKEHAEEVI